LRQAGGPGILPGEIVPGTRWIRRSIKNLYDDDKSQRGGVAQFPSGGPVNLLEWLV
jgi:hypothetical protein